MPHDISFRPSAAKELRKLPGEVQKAVREKIDRLSGDPRPPGNKKLEGSDDLHRIRIGDYRVVYKVDDDAQTVEIVRVADRKDVYR